MQAIWLPIYVFSILGLLLLVTSSTTLSCLVGVMLIMFTVEATGYDTL